MCLTKEEGGGRRGIEEGKGVVGERKRKDEKSQVYHFRKDRREVVKGTCRKCHIRKKENRKDEKCQKCHLRNDRREEAK